MAKYRQIHVSYWQDGFILSLPPEEKYFYIYLMTNSKTTQCGIYELPLKVVEIETGLSSDRIFELIHKFVRYRRIEFNEETREIMLLNWLKHNSLKSPKVMSCAMKELEQIKHIPYLEQFERLCKQYKYPIDTLSIPYPKGYKPSLHPYGEEREQEEEKEQEEKTVVVENSFSVFEREGFGTITFYIKQEIDSLVEDYTEEWVIAALRESVVQGKRKLSYVKGILKSWKSDGRDSNGKSNVGKSQQASYRQDPELEYRREEIARNKWINEGNDPDAFNYRTASNH